MKPDGVKCAVFIQQPEFNFMVWQGNFPCEINDFVIAANLKYGYTFWIFFHQTEEFFLFFHFLFADRQKQEKRSDEYEMMSFHFFLIADDSVKVDWDIQAEN